MNVIHAIMDWGFYNQAHKIGIAALLSAGAAFLAGHNDVAWPALVFGLTQLGFWYQGQADAAPPSAKPRGRDKWVEEDVPRPAA